MARERDVPSPNKWQKMDGLFYVSDVKANLFHSAAAPQVVFLIFQTLLFPPAELTPGLAALTVGCDSGNLGSLSRVQLLLLDRLEPETLPSPFGQEEEFLSEQDWSDLRMRYDPGLTSPGTELHEKDA